MPENEPLIPPHGGYRNLKTFQIAQLIYDLTVRFCNRYIDVRSRTHDQMVQGARSVVQNIAEGSQASGTSKKSELKLTNVARASLEELKLDYEDFLRQRGLPRWRPDEPVLMRFKDRRCNSVEAVRQWVAEERANTGVLSSALAANATLSLLNLCCYLLQRQLAAQAGSFGQDGGFTERLYRFRKDSRRKGNTD